MKGIVFAALLCSSQASAQTMEAPVRGVFHVSAPVFIPAFKAPEARPAASPAPGMSRRAEASRKVLRPAPFSRPLIAKVRRRIAALVSGMREGRAFAELGSRALLRLIGDPQLIVRSRGFVPSAGLQAAVDLDSFSRFVFQARSLSPEQKVLLGRIQSYTDFELDQGLPPVEEDTRRLLLDPSCGKLMRSPYGRSLPDESGLRKRRDFLGVRLERAAAKGAGSSHFGLPPWMRIRPVGAVGGKRVEKLLAEVDETRSPVPRVLTVPEMALLHPGRAAGSCTLAEPGSSQDRWNFQEAAALVNAWARRGEDLDFDKMQALSRLLLRGTEDGGEAGRLRDFDSALDQYHWKDPYASWREILAYLGDFMLWYRAHEGSLHPVLLAAESYQQLVRIHPAFNANGRAWRLVMDFILQRNGFLPPVFHEVDRETIRGKTASVAERVVRGILDSAAALK
jgi:hypothetical protein